jgi:RNA polymerase sigma-70 factor (ECF subfamily)
MRSDLPFTDLMRRLQEGDAEAAQAVFDQYARRLVRLAAARLPRLLSAKFDPEDVVQSVFKSFFTRQADARFTLDGPDSLWALLTFLTVRKCGHRVRHFRAARRDVRRETGPAADPNPSTCWDMPAPEPTPAEAVLLAETLHEVLQGLPPAQRTIVQFRLEGYSFEEISQKVGCTERTAYRVLEKVRARLSEPVGAGAAN